MDAFTRALGTKQGRIKPVGASPTQGDYVFCLGHDTPGHAEQINEGEFVEVFQNITFEAGTKLLRVSVNIRPPTAAPAGLKWRVSLRIDEVERAYQDLAPGGRTRMRAFSANVSKLGGGAHKVALRLQLVSTVVGVQYMHTAGAIASAEAFGTATVMPNLTLAPVSIISGEGHSTDHDVTTWSPLDDVGTLSLLLMPGDYDPDALGAGVGRWVDSSGNARHADLVTGANPADDGFGNPVFDGATTWLDIVGASLADSVSYPGAAMADPDNGSIIVIEKQTSLDADIGDYFNPAFISGTGATPGLYASDTYTKTVGYDGATYVQANAPSGVAASGVAHIQFGAWDATGLYAACDENAFGAVVPYGVGPLSVGNIGADTWIGRSYQVPMSGTLYLVAVYPTKISDAKVAQWRAWAIAQGLV